LDSISNVDPHEFLSRCQANRVEHRQMKFEGKSYFIPYSTVQIGEHKLEGLRENEKRINLLRDIIGDYANKPTTHLDVGCNLGVFVESLKDIFKSSEGVDADSYYIEQCRFLYPETKSKFHLANLNDKPLTSLFQERFDVITALSMFEYITFKQDFVSELFNMTDQICIVEGHSEDILLGRDVRYENLLRTQDWKVVRMEETTDVGINAPIATQATGRPVWVCVK